LTDIYPAGEAPIPGVTIEALAAAVQAAAPGRVRLVKSLDELPSAIAGLAQPGDIVITLGAGSIGTTPPHILAALRSASGPSEGMGP
jgi:UDP-N-acetylmuramate--alanine ligase